MTIDRFADILAAYGGSAARWPDDERPAAQRLLDRSGTARDLLAGEAELDTFLGHVPAPAPASAALRARIVNIAGARPPVAAASETGLWQRLRDIWSDLGALRPAGAALAASLMLGVMFGGTFAPAASEPDTIDLMELALLELAFRGY